MDRTNHQNIIEYFLKYLANRDLEKLTNLFANRIDWYIPGDEKNVPWLGKRSTKEEVKDFYKTLWENTEPVAANIETILIEYENAVITGEFSTKMLKTNTIIHSPFSIQLTVEHNLIVKYRLIEDSFAVSEAMQ